MTTNSHTGRIQKTLAAVGLIVVLAAGILIPTTTTYDALLEGLVAHATDPRFAYIHDWERDDMVLWDNWRTMHSALGTPPGCNRVVQRTTLRGERATGRLL